MRSRLPILVLATCAACSGSSRIVLPLFEADVTAPTVAVPAGAPVTVRIDRFTLPPSGEDAVKIGTARTGVSKRHASVRLSEHPGELLARGLRGGVEQAGIQTGADADYSIDGTIARFSVEEQHAADMLQTSVALVRFDLVVNDLRGGEPRPVLARQYESEAVSYPAIDATKSQRHMVEQAVAESVQAVLDDPDLWRAIGVAYVAAAPITAPTSRAPATPRPRGAR